MTDGWLGVFNGTEDQTLFVAEMREALNLAERVGGLEPVERCISEWRITAEALADPVARAILTGSVSEDDFTEAGRPGD